MENDRLRADLDALATRARKADHYVEICNLQAAYGYYVDKGRWRSFMMVGALGAEARWGEATCENAYRIENGRWRIALLHGYMNVSTDFDQGWHKSGVKLLRSIDGLQPDRPPTLEYEAYPEAVVAPYH